MTRARWATSACRLIAGAALAVAPFFSPPLRGAVVAVERVIAPALFTLAVALAALDALRPHRARRAWELRVARWLGRWGWAPAIFLFLVPVWAHWSLQPPGAAAALGALLGHIPWSDVNQHYEGARRLLADGAFGAYSERRPLNAALLGVRLALAGGSLHAAIALQAALCAVAAWLFARAVAVRAGLPASLAAFALTLALARDFLPMAATEPLGITFACLALAILLTPWARARLTWAACGLLALDAALRARPGAQLVVPAVLLWALWLFRRQWRRALPVVAAVAVAGSVSTALLNRLYGAGEATFTTYPAYTLYGLTRGSNWTQARADFGEELERSRPEKEVARFLYARAFENLRRQPGVFARTLWRNLRRFAGKLPGNLARVASLRPLLHADAGPPSGDDVALDARAAAPLLLAAFAAFIAYLVRAPAADRLFWMAATLGLLASVPFVYGDAGFRGLAAVYPLMAGALAIGLGRRAPLAREETQRAIVRGAAALAVALLAIALAGPALARALTRRPSPGLLQQAEAGAVVLVPADSPAVIISARPAGAGRTPRIERRDLLRMLAWAGLEPQQEAHLAGARPPFAVLSAYDYAARRQRLLLAPVEVLREGGALLAVQVQAVPGSAFLDVVGWRRLGEAGAPRHDAAPTPEAEPEG